MYTTYYMCDTKYVASPAWFEHFNNCQILWRTASKSNNRSLLSQTSIAQSIKKKKNTLKRFDRAENAVCAPRERRGRAMNKLQQMLARRRSAMDAIMTLWERCVHAITGKIDILYPCYNRTRFCPLVLRSRIFIKRVEVGLKRAYLAKRWLEHDYNYYTFRYWLDCSVPQTVQNGINRLCTTF